MQDVRKHFTKDTNPDNRILIMYLNGSKSLIYRELRSILLMSNPRCVVPLRKENEYMLYRESILQHK
jgi:hypothetical protein